MSSLTIFLARFIGLFTIILVAALLVRGNTTVAAAMADGPVMLVYAISSLAIGVAMIVGHTVWMGGALPVVVTLVGWIILAKGLLLLLVTPETFAAFYGVLGYGDHFDLALIPALVLGLYLTWGGFRAKRAN